MIALVCILAGAFLSGRFVVWDFSPYTTRFDTIHLMYGQEGNSYFCFPESPDRRGKHQDSRENKTNYFLDGPYIKCFVIYLDFPFNNHSKTN